MAQVTISYEEYTRLISNESKYKDLMQRYASDMDKIYSKDESWKPYDQMTPAFCELLYGYWETEDDWVVFVGERQSNGSVINVYNGLVMPATHWKALPFPPYPCPRNYVPNPLDL